MTISREDVMAFVDGELGIQDCERIEAAAAEDSELARSIDTQRALREQLKAHFTSIPTEALPEQWLRQIHLAATPAAEVMDLATIRENKAGQGDRPRRTWHVGGWASAAIAASLVLGVFVGAQLRGVPSAGPIDASNGELLAVGELRTALNTQLGSAQDGAPFRILASFRTSDNELCRAFSGRLASGIACHQGRNWNLRHVLPGVAPSQTDYRQAGSQDAEVAALAEGMATGAAMNEAQEREAKAGGWQ